MSGDYQNRAGQPGSQKLPVSGQPGTAFQNFQEQRMHPAAMAAMAGPKPMQASRPDMPTAGSAIAPAAPAAGATK